MQVGEASDVSCPREDLHDRAQRKRPRSETGEGHQEPVEEGGSGEETIPPPKITTARRGRGRPPRVGLHKAKKDTAEMTDSGTSKDIRTDEERHSAPPSRMPSRSPVRMRDPDDCPATELKDMVEEALEEIRSVSRVSKGLKGTCQKTLKLAVQKISNVTGILLSRTVTEEITKLRAENASLAAQVKDLVAIQEALRADITSLRQERNPQNIPPPPAAKETTELTKLVAEIASLNARFSAMEGRMLRPPLGVRRQAAASTKTASYAAKAAAPNLTADAAKKREGSNKKHARSGPDEARVPDSAPVETVSISAQDASSATGNEWQTVGARKKAKKSAKKAPKKATQKAKAPRLPRVPRSTAVVLTIQPAAKERGLDYGAVLKKARAEIDLEALQIESGIKMKSTRTCARLIEIPGATSGAKADALADKLRASFDVEDVVIARPIKCTNLRISGLDDSVTSEEVTAAVARAADCRQEDVRCGPIRPGIRGLGTALVKCPVAAARKLADGRRILVGWVSAQIKLLEATPLRCYRCLAVGHLGIQCSANIDCSERCFRCSRPGHKAATCGSTPHCFLCAAAGIPAEHRLGSKSCAGPNKSWLPAPRQEATDLSVGAEMEIH